MPRAARRVLRPRPEPVRNDAFEPLGEEVVIAQEMTTPVRARREVTTSTPLVDPSRSVMNRTLDEDESEGDVGEVVSGERHVPLRTMRKKRQRRNYNVETPPEVKNMKCLDEIIKESAIPFKKFPAIPASYPTTIKTESGSEIVADTTIVVEEGVKREGGTGGSDSSPDAAKLTKGRGRGGRKRGRPRGSKSSTYNLRNGRKKPVLKPAFGPGAANAASTSSLMGTLQNDGEGNLPRDQENDEEVKSARGDATKKAEKGESVTMVRPLFSRHYIVRRPFALPNEKPIEFVMHETYFSRINPYSAKKTPGEQNITPCNDDLKFFQEAIHNLMNGMNAVETMPHDHLPHEVMVDPPQEVLPETGSQGQHPTLSKPTPDLDDTLETKTSLENAEEVESDERDLEEKPNSALPMPDNFMTNILFMDASDKANDLNDAGIGIQFNPEIEASVQKRRSAVDVCRVLESSGC